MSYKVLLPLLAASVSVASAQGTQHSGAPILHGITVDTAGSPLRGVEVFAGGQRWRAVSDDSGRFRFAGLEAGKHVVFARRLGLLPESLSTVLRGGDTSFLRIILRAQAAQLGEVVVGEERSVPARLEGFERRRASRNGGQFITRQDIERTSPIAPTNLIRHMQGIKLIDSMGVTLAISSRGPKLQLIGGRPVPVQCVVRVGVDGSLREPYFPMNSITLQDIYGIEVYAGAASVPSEFGGARRDAACGLIMIWTRSY